MRNYLTFGGRDSRDFGVYISGQGTFSAPEKAYTFYSIPGRSGALIGNERRLENIKVSYECFIYSNFSQNIADFRTFLLSLDGYQELTDSYHPDEFRLACYTGPFEPTVTTKNDAGSFTLTFNCKPQRYLYSGRNHYYWAAGGHQTITGKSITAETSMLDQSVLTSYCFLLGSPLKVAVSTMYFNHIPVRTASYDLITDYPSEWELNWITGAGTITATYARPQSTDSWHKSDSTTFYIEYAGASQITVPRNIYSPISTKTGYYDFFDGAPTFNTGTHRLSFKTKSNYATADDFKAALATKFGAGNPFCYVSLDLITPKTFSFSPVSLPASGECSISCEDPFSLVTVEYTSSGDMENPTPFPSEPLIRVTGSGSFDMDGVTVTVNTPGTYTDIDCELMDCYEGTTNRNANVTFSTYDFPKLQPGQNAITINTGITLIEIWPRWWRV